MSEVSVDQSKEAPRKVLGRLMTGETVIDRLTSHLHPGVEALLPEALPRINSQQRDYIVAEVDLGRTVGRQTCVETTGDDEVVYAQRPNRKGLTRFVKGRESAPTSSLTVILMRQKDAMEPTYITMSAFVGKPSEMEPWDAKATPASAEYWKTHALIWGAEPVVEGTETTECPWA